MIRIKNEEQIRLMQVAGKLVGALLYDLADFVRPGISTLDIDRLVAERIAGEGMQATFKGYDGFPASACVSINEELVHGIPSDERVLKDGDIVSVDIGATHKGWVADAARTYYVGNVPPEKKRLVEACKQSFFEALLVCRAGNHLSDIGHAVQSCVEANGFSVVREYVGHGVGSQMHESPAIKNYGEPGQGVVLRKGMALAIEPMVNMGGADVYVRDDDWTVATVDGKPAAHYENTVVITDGEPLVITLDKRDR